MSDSSIDNFIKKYKLALTNQSKEIRFTTQEVGDIVCAIAALNNNSIKLDEISKKLDDALLMVSQPRETVAVPMDGGSWSF